MTKITMNVEGMMCGHCEAHMNDAIRNIFPTAKVTSSHTKKETVIITKDVITDEKLGEIVKSVGYTLLGIKREPYEKKGIFAKLIK